VLSLLKLLTVRRGKSGAGRGFFELWLERSGRKDSYRKDFRLSGIIASLPRFATTGSYESEAVLKVNTADHGLLKDRYQKIFLGEWESRKGELKERYSISGWEAAAYNGIVEKRGISRFGEAGRGGLKINFLNQDSIPVAAVWMRGSATEPVFRIMADAELPGFERDLIFWQQRMVREADQWDGRN
jgi:phosphoglucomutase